MAYLGNAPARSFISFERQVFTIVNSQTAYTLDHSVNNENDIRLVVNNVVQEPGSGKAYTASGTTLTLSAALTNGTDEMYCVFLGRATATNAPGAGSVGTSQLASEAVTNAKVASTVITGQSAETTIADDDLILISDTSASAALKKMTKANFVSGVGGTNTPAFEANITGSNANFTQTTWTKVTFNGEVFDTDSKYDNSSNYRFTPGTAGKYFIYAMIKVQWGGAAGNGQYIAIYKNGSLYRSGGINGQTIDSIYTYSTIDFNTTDYVEIYVYSGSNYANAPYTENRHVFGGYRILT